MEHVTIARGKQMKEKKTSLLREGIKKFIAKSQEERTVFIDQCFLILLGFTCCAFLIFAWAITAVGVRL